MVRKETRDQAVIKAVLDGLETKANWAALMKELKAAREYGFDDSDFTKALIAMKKSDRKYWSPHSIFLKTDYWLKVYEEKKEEHKRI